MNINWRVKWEGGEKVKSEWNGWEKLSTHIWRFINKGDKRSNNGVYIGAAKAETAC